MAFKLKDTEFIWVVEFAGKHKWIPIGEPWTSVDDATFYLKERRSNEEGNFRLSQYRRKIDSPRKRRSKTPKTPRV